MPKYGSIDFDQRIIDAIRNDKLVVFAGAGVSIGPPSNLGSFKDLVECVANGTGFDPIEPYDRFLGVLNHRKVMVHELTKQFLTKSESKPCELHRDLLRLFRSADRVRLITTNFDLHFETAAQELFQQVPEVYRAPALPLGYDFSGIVHIHGALPQSSDFVLTDADFGRAYLTEGWARRFLVDVFRNYTVMFIGYSHNDVVMNYLTRALPVENVSGRFVLTEEEGQWDILGIQPLRFKREYNGDSYSHLNNGVKILAERTSRGAFDWQSILAVLGKKEPPNDEEAISEIEEALQSVPMTKFLLNDAQSTKWLEWFNRRKYLDELFRPNKLSLRDLLFADWLVQHFVIDHPDLVIEIVVEHKLRLSPELWRRIAHTIGVSDDISIEEHILKKWVAILLKNMPENVDYHSLMLLAEKCGRRGYPDLTVKLLLAMSQQRLEVKSDVLWPMHEEGDRYRLLVECPLIADHWTLNEVWSVYLRPSLPRVAQSLLSGVVQHIEEIHNELVSWDKAESDWDPMSYRRSAIEPHEQDQHPDPIDVVIDVARDTLEYLSVNSTGFYVAWIEMLISSKVPLLRRLAIHGINSHPNWTHDDRLLWLLERLGLGDLIEHHEVHRVLKLSYPFASVEIRKALVDRVMGVLLPETDQITSAKRTARKQFEWLSWLKTAKPDCELLAPPLAAIEAEYPEWKLSEHPDLTHWVGSTDWVGLVSPWTVEQLLSKDPEEQINDLHSFEGDRFNGPSRDGLLANCLEACKRNWMWAKSLARILIERAEWSSDLWPVILRGLSDSKLSSNGWKDLLQLITHVELQAAHAAVIARLLNDKVADKEDAISLDLLEEANVIAHSTWNTLEISDQFNEFKNWLNLAINHPAGVIVEFWIKGLSKTIETYPDAKNGLPENYNTWFTMVINDTTRKGDLGRSVLASQTALLFGVDEKWTKQHIIPLFSDDNPIKFAQAWDGFLTWGRLYPELVDELLPAFIAAMRRLDTDLIESRRRFVEFYTTVVTLYVSDPLAEMIPVLLNHGSIKDRITFTSHLGHFVKKMDDSARQSMWSSWLKRYWQNRIYGIPQPFDDSEVELMLNWLPYLGSDFPSAVNLLKQTNAIKIEYTHAFSDLLKSDLIYRFPTDTAELLIYLADCDIKYHKVTLLQIKNSLPQLPEDVSLRLAEAFANAGMIE
jgi:hypothetical protein